MVILLLEGVESAAKRGEERLLRWWLNPIMLRRRNGPLHRRVGEGCEMRWRNSHKVHVSISCLRG